MDTEIFIAEEHVQAIQRYVAARGTAADGHVYASYSKRYYIDKITYRGKVTGVIIEKYCNYTEADWAICRNRILARAPLRLRHMVSAALNAMSEKNKKTLMRTNGRIRGAVPRVYIPIKAQI